MKNFVFLIILSLLFVSCASNVSHYDINDAEVAREVRALMAPREVVKGKNKVSESEIVKEYEDLLTDLKVGKGKFERDKIQQLGDLYMGVQSNRDALIYRSYEDVDNTGIRGGNFKKAIMLYSNVLEMYPDDPGNDEVLYQLAHAYLKMKNIEKSIETLEKFLKKFPGVQLANEVRFRLAELYFTEGDMTGARELYLESIENNENASYYNFVFYKLGWAYFNTQEYGKAISHFLDVLDETLIYKESGKSYVHHPTRSFAGGEAKFVKDVIKGISLSVIYLDSLDDMNKYFIGNRELYAEHIYINVAEFFEIDQKIDDVVNTYNAYISAFPLSVKAPTFKQKIIDLYAKNELVDMSNKERTDYVEMFGPGSRWYDQNPLHHVNVMRNIRKIVDELARYYHAKAQQEKTEELFQLTFHWYRKYLEFFGADPLAGNVSYLLAEALFIHGDYAEASKQYGVAGYNYGKFKKAEDAAYAAVYSLEKGLQGSFDDEGKELRKMMAVESARFIERYTQNDAVPDIITRVVDMLYTEKEYVELRVFSEKLISKLNTTPLVGGRVATKEVVATVKKYVADSFYNDADYVKAFDAYYNLSDDKSHTMEPAGLKELAASSLYKQAKLFKNDGDFELAKARILKLYLLMPDALITPAAIFDLYAFSLSNQNMPVMFTALKILNIQYPEFKHLESKAPDLLLTFLKKMYNEDNYVALRGVSEGIVATYDYVKSKNGLDERTRNGWFFFEIDRLKADSYFREKRYLDAFDAYGDLLKTYDIQETDELYNLKKLMASSLYKEGSRQLEAGKLREAAQIFIKIYRDVPEIDVVPAALFKSGEIYLDLKDYAEVGKVYEMLSNFNNETYDVDLAIRLAKALEDDGKMLEAAEQYTLLGEIIPDYEQSVEALNKSAEIFENEGKIGKAYVLYNDLIDSFAYDVDRKLEIIFKTAQLATQIGDVEESLNLYKRISEEFEKPDSARGKYIISTSYFKIAENAFLDFEDVEIVEPLEINLAKKKKSLKSVLKLYSKAAGFNVAETATMATYKAAVTLESFVDALLHSQKPKGLSRSQKKLYAKILIKKVKPYNKKAVKTYMSNVKRTQKFKTYDKWIKLSYGALVELYPSRYNKSEKRAVLSKKLKSLGSVVKQEAVFQNY